MANSYAVWNIRSADPTLAPVGTGSGGKLGKHDFLELLVAQLRAQNPLEPMKNTEFATQTAQYEMLEQLQNMYELVQGAQALGSLSQASGLIGKYVTAAGLDNTTIEGIVHEVTIKDGQALLLVGDTVVPIDDVLVVGGEAPTEATGGEEWAGDEAPADGEDWTDDGEAAG
jgi:flagellar basal-body rod modification protein FlgD